MARRVDIVQATCDYCGKSFSKPPKDVLKCSKHFCCRDHYMRYKREFHYNFPPDQKLDNEAQRKLKEWAKIRNGLTAQKVKSKTQ